MLNAVLFITLQFVIDTIIYFNFFFYIDGLTTNTIFFKKNQKNNNNIFFKLISLLIFILFITSSNLVAQNKEQIVTKNSDSIKIVELITTANSFFYTTPDTAISYLQKASIIEGNHPNIKSKIRIAGSLGIAYNLRNELDSAFYYLSQSESLAHKYNLKEDEVNATINIGIVYSKQRKFEKSLNQYFKALSFFEKTKQQEKISGVLNNIGIVLINQERFKEAIFYYKKSIKVMPKNAITGAGYLNISASYLSLSKLDSAVYYIKLATDKFKQKKDDFGLMLSEGILGDICVVKEAYNLAQEHYNNSIRMSNAFGENFTIEGFLNLGNLFNKLKQFKKAEKYYLKVEKIANKFQDKNVLDDIYRELGKINLAKKKYKLAATYFSKRIAIHDSIYTIEKKQKVADIIAKYEIKEKQQKIEFLNEINNTKTQKIKARNFGIVSLFLLVVSLLTLIVLIKQKAKQKINKINNELQKYLLKLKNLDIGKHELTIDSEEFFRKHELTKQEIAVLKLLNKGMSYSVIGETIFISKNTVKYHLKNIYLKLDVKNRIEALNKLKT